VTSGELDPSLMLVTDAASCGGRGVIATVEAGVDGGVTAVQVREKEGDAAATLGLVLAVADVCHERAAVLVNDRVDVFLAARQLGAPVTGVHVGQRDLPVEPVRALVGPDAVVGLTADTPAHLDAVRALPEGTVDYLGVGAIRASVTKPDHPRPLGVVGFGEVCAASRLPCVAIGGVVADDVGPVLAAGGVGVAVASAICGASDPAGAARRFSKELDRARA
jgi:thiamine-phosphate diphosphorylase